MSDLSLENLTKQIEEDPNNPNHYSSRADHYFNNEEYEKAIDDLSKAISLIPEDDFETKSSLLTDRGENYLFLEQIRSAIKDLTSSIKIGRDFIFLHRMFNLRGDAYNCVGNKKKANEDFTQAIKLSLRNSRNNEFQSLEEKEAHDSNLATYYFNRGRTRFLLNDKKSLKRSLDDFEVAISLFADDMSKLECHKERCKVHEKILEEWSWKYTSKTNKTKTTDAYLKDLSFLIDNPSSHDDEIIFLTKRANLNFNEKKNNEDSMKDIKLLFSNHKNQLNTSQKIELHFLRSKIFNEKKEYHKSIQDLDYVINNISETTLLEKKIECLEYRAYVYLSIQNQESAISDYNFCINILTKKKKVIRSGLRYKCNGLKKKIGDIYFDQKKYSKTFEEYTFYFDQMKVSESLVDYAYDIFQIAQEMSYPFFSLNITERIKLQQKNICLEQSELAMTKLIKKLSKLPSLREENFFMSIHSFRGDVRFYREEYQKAIDDYTFLINNKPDHGNGIAFYDRGVSNQRIGKNEEMIEDFTTFLKYRNIYIGNNMDNNKKEFIKSTLEILEKAYKKKEKSFLEYYYGHLSKSTLAKELKDLQKIDMTIPICFYNSCLERGFFISTPNVGSTKENMFLNLGVFMAYTALYELKDPEKMFEIATYCMIMKKNEMKGENYKLFDHFIKDYSLKNENKMERLEFVIDSGILSNETMQDEEEESTVINVKWKSCDQNIFIKKYFLKSFLKVNEDIMDIDNTFELSQKVPQIDPMIIYKCLYGFNLSKKELFTNIFKLFFFFKELHLFGYIFILCCSVSQLSLKEHLILFNRSISKFEKKKRKEFEEEEEEEEGEEVDFIEGIIDGNISDDMNTVSFNSPISLSLFKGLQANKEEIEESKSYVQALYRLGYLIELKQGKSKELKDHSLFVENNLLIDVIPNLKGKQEQQLEYPIKTYFEEYFDKVVLKDIYKSKLFASHFLTTNSKFILSPGTGVHKEILILKSNFFYQMFKFPGREANSKKITIDDMNLSSLGYLLKTIYRNNYTWKTYSYDLRSLFELLIHSEMYNNMLLKSKVIQLIDGIFEEYAKKDELVLKLFENGKYFEKMPEWYLNFMVWRWESLTKMKGSSIRDIIKHSIKTEKLANSMRNEIEELKKVNKRKRTSDDSNPNIKKRKR